MTTVDPAGAEELIGVCAVLGAGKPDSATIDPGGEGMEPVPGSVVDADVDVGVGAAGSSDVAAIPAPGGSTK